MAILPNLTEMTREQLMALVEAQAKAQERKLSFKVTATKPDGSGTNGAISVYGLGRFPITLYESQWERLWTAMPALREFMTANAALLARK